MRTAPSNGAFDASLRPRTPAWVVRDLADAKAFATAAALRLASADEMRAGNLTVVLPSALQP